MEFTQREVPWCGACERDFIKWFIAHARGRHRKIKVDGKTKVIKFYDLAYNPREEDELDL